MDTKNLVIGLLAGAAVGVAVGILMAPTSGRETRQKLATGSRKFTDNISGTVDDVLESLKKRFSSEHGSTVKDGMNVAMDQEVK